MALFMKQDFSPPILSRKWIAIKFRPNMLLYSRDHIISILESGLLFREDSIEVEQECPAPEDMVSPSWFTSGEKVLGAALIAAGLALLPPKRLSRATLFQLSACACAPLAVRLCHRRLARASALCALLMAMREYLALARRAAAIAKEFGAVVKEIESVSAVAESTASLLRRQQSGLAALLARASSALLGNAPWLRGDVAWDALEAVDAQENFIKIHHAFLVVQSTLLKHIAMAHYIPSVNAQRLYKNHNERIYWLHTVLIPHITREFKENFEQLDRMYRLLKNYGNAGSDSKKPGAVIGDSWLYSEIHSGVAKASIELKMAATKCTSLDMLLDSAAMNKQEIDLDVLNKDIEDLIDKITKCLVTTQNSQLRLKKLKSKVNPNVKENGDGENNMVAVESAGNVTAVTELPEPEPKDEVFYCDKTQDEGVDDYEPMADVTTMPGKKEKENTRVVLSELKRKLVKREDLMRERERQALSKTMNMEKVPEFPRQINVEPIDLKGFVCKIRVSKPKKLFRRYRIQRGKKDRKMYVIKKRFEEDSSKIRFKALVYKRTSEISIDVAKRKYILILWQKGPKCNFSSSSGLSDVETNASNKIIHQAINNIDESHKNLALDYKFSKKDLELSSSSSDTDFDIGKKEIELLRDVRRHRVARKKNFPLKRGNGDQDESMKPVEYSFGTGMAMASVLQVKRPNLEFAQEEVFAGDGEISGDSGNDEDA